MASSSESELLIKISELIKAFDRPSPAKLPEWVQGCYEEYPLKYFQSIRRFLSNENSQTTTLIKKVIDTGIVPRILQLLQSNNYTFSMLLCGYLRQMSFNFVFPVEISKLIDAFCDIHCVDEDLQCAGRHILANVTAGTDDQTQYVIDIGVVPILMEGIESNMTNKIKEISFHALSNIIAHDKTCKDFVLSHDILKKMKVALEISPDHLRIELFQSASFCLSNMCRTEHINHKWDIWMIDILQHFIQCSDESVLENCCWAIEYAAKIPMTIQAMVRNGLAKKCFEYFGHESDKIRHPALRAMGSMIAYGNDEQTQYFVDCGLLNKIRENLKNENEPRNIKRESGWLISNICADNHDQIQAVYDAQLFPILISLMDDEYEDVATEAFWAICNLFVSGHNRIIDYVVDLDAINALFAFLKSMENVKENISFLCVGLEAISYLVNTEKYIHLIKDCNGLDYLKKMRNASEDELLFVDKRNKKMIDDILNSGNWGK